MLTQRQVYLAMEQKEELSADKAGQLMSTFEKSFLHVHATFHPPGIPGEIAGKSSNVAWAARRIMEVHRADLKMDCCNVIVTVMDCRLTPRPDNESIAYDVQPTPTSLAITSQKSVDCTTRTSPKQTARSIVALLSSTVMPTKVLFSSDAPICSGPLRDCRPCTLGHGSRSRPPSTRCLYP